MEKIESFYRTLEELLKNVHFEPSHICGLDETGIASEKWHDTVIAERGQKHVIRFDNGFIDRASLCHICTAAGRSLPPFLTISGAHMTDDLFNGLPDDTKIKMTESGYFNGSTLLPVLQHIHEHAPPHSAEKPLLLFLDQCSCHLDIDALQWALDHHIIFFFLPSHCTHLLQVSDLACFRSFKQALRVGIANFNLTHPTRHVSKHDLGPIINEAWIRGMNSSNIIAGFKAAGIHPFDPTQVTLADLESTHPSLPDWMVNKENADPNTRPIIRSPILDVKQLKQELFTPIRPPPEPKLKKPTVIDKKGGVLTKKDVEAYLSKVKQHEQEVSARKDKSKKKLKEEQYRTPAYHLRELLERTQALVDMNICLICDSADGPDKWLQCSRCSRWYHYQCLELQENSFRRGDVKYSCPFCLIASAKLFNKPPEDVMAVDLLPPLADDFPPLDLPPLPALPVVE